MELQNTFLKTSNCIAKNAAFFTLKEINDNSSLMSVGKYTPSTLNFAM